MASLKLFISHSSNLDEIDAQGCPLGKNWELLRETCKAIRDHYGNRVEILVDYEGLTPASEWRARLDDWLGECDAAIILFSKRALEDSLWVKFEASILRWRSSRDPAFILLPVLLEGESNPKDLEESFWGAIGIGNRQCIRSAAGAAQIVAGVRGVLGELDQPDAGTTFGARFKAVRDLIEECLNRPNHGKSLQTVWDAVSGGRPAPSWPDDPVRRNALGLAQLLFGDTEQSVRTFKKIVQSMHPPFQRPLDLFHYIRPLWVDAAAAECLKAWQTNGFLLALNGDYVNCSDAQLKTNCYTLDRYLERAVLHKSVVRVVQAPRPDPNAIRDEIRTSVDKQWPSYPKERIDRVDKRVRTLDSPVVALVPASDGLPDPRLVDDLKRLRDEVCPKLVCVFATGGSMPSAIPADIRPVLPELDPDCEYEHYGYELDARSVLPDA